MRGLQESFALTKLEIKTVKLIKNVIVKPPKLHEMISNWKVITKPYRNHQRTSVVKCVCTICNETEREMAISQLNKCPSDRCQACAIEKRRGNGYKRQAA